MKTQKILVNLFLIISVATVLVACSKEKIDSSEIPDTGISDQLYKQKFEALITSNHSRARQLGIDFPITKDTIRQSFKSYQAAYEFIAALKKGVTSTKTDTAVIDGSSNKAMSALATITGTDNFTYSVFCSNAASISGTWGTGTITGNWSVSGNLAYSYTQHDANAAKSYKHIMPTSTTLTDPAMAYSGVGTMSPSSGGWNGSAASYSMTKNAQVNYTITVNGNSINGSSVIRVSFSASIGWTPTPQSVYVNHTMNAQAY